MKRNIGNRLVEYKAWDNMIDRCTNESHAAYPNYGGRGINVCDRWRVSFDAFYADLGPRPSAGHSLDRIDNEWHYQPDNCRWATALIQRCNRRQRQGTRMVAIAGSTFSMKQWSLRSGIPYQTLRARLNAGWVPELAIAHPTPSQRRLEVSA